MPLEIEAAGTVLRLLSAMAVFGTTVDIGRSELAIETFLPMDDATA